MNSRVRRTLLAVFFALFVAASAVAAPDGGRESNDWIVKQISRIVHHLKTIIFPFADSDPIPPKP
jgi:hypothetical protein